MGVLLLTHKDGTQHIVNDELEPFYRSRNRIFPENQRWVEMKRFDTRAEALQAMNKPGKTVKPVPKPAAAPAKKKTNKNA